MNGSNSDQPRRPLDPGLSREDEARHRDYVQRTLREGRDITNIRAPGPYVATRDGYQRSRDQGLDFAVGMDHLEGRTRETGWAPEKAMETPLGRRIHDNTHEKDRHRVEYKSGSVDEKAILQLRKDAIILGRGYTIEWILAPGTKFDPRAKVLLRRLEREFPGQFLVRTVTQEQYEQALRVGGQIREREARAKEARDREAQEKADRERADQVQALEQQRATLMQEFRDREKRALSADRAEALSRSTELAITAIEHTQQLLEVTHDPDLTAAQAAIAQEIARVTTRDLLQQEMRVQEQLTQDRNARLLDHEQQVQQIEQQIQQLSADRDLAAAHEQERQDRITEQAQANVIEESRWVEKAAESIHSREVIAAMDILAEQRETLEVSQGMDDRYRAQQKERDDMLKARGKEGQRLAELARVMEKPYSQARGRPLTPAEQERQDRLQREMDEVHARMKGRDGPSKGISRER